MKELSENSNYCIEFLRNAGERTRATRLAMELGVGNALDAIRYVNSLHSRVPLSTNRERKRFKRCEACNCEWHEATPECPVCHSKNLKEVER